MGNCNNLCAEQTPNYKFQQDICTTEQRQLPNQFRVLQENKRKTNNQISRNVKKKSVIYFENGCVYEGDWDTNKKRHGYGIYKWKDGSIYSGYWKDNQASGYGKLVHSDGDVYEGNWELDKADGYGEYIQKNGTTYKGYWKDDLQHGEGIEIWKDSAQYKGYYKCGKKEGKGRLQFADGSYYEGQFKNNFINEQGKFVWNNGKTYEGSWFNNKMSGKGIMKWPDGKIFEGEFQNDLKHGKGKLSLPNGQVYEGQWVEGRYKNTKVKIKKENMSIDSIELIKDQNFEQLFYVFIVFSSIFFLFFHTLLQYFKLQIIHNIILFILNNINLVFFSLCSFSYYHSNYTKRQQMKSNSLIIQ